VVCFQVLTDITGVAFSPDGKTLAAASYAKSSIKLWDAATLKEAATLKGHGREVKSIVFSPDSKTLASGSVDGTIRLWEVSTGKNIATLPPAASAAMTMLCVAFSPDGKTVAGATAFTNKPGKGPIPRGSIRLWNVATGANFASFPGHVGNTLGIVFSKDGETLISGGADTMIRFWNVRQERVTRTVKASAPVSALALSADGNTLASAGIDCKIQLWDLIPAQK